MKVLTVHQPWATLIACGAKRYETRSWAPSAKALPTGSLLAIHASQQEGTKGFDAMGRAAEAEASRLFDERGIDLGTPLPRGKVLCVCRVVGFFPTAPLGGLYVIPNTDAVSYPAYPETELGDFSPGRYAWELEVVEVLDPPIPARGRQGLWEWERP